jgi:hypothetical protein
MPEPLDPERVRRVLLHVARYRLTTPEALSTVEALRLKTKANAHALLQRLVIDGLLGEAPFDRHGGYFFLTDVGGRDVFGRRNPVGRRSGPLSEPAKVRAFAMLAFCRLMATNRELLSPDDLRRAVPDIETGGMASSFYVERNPTTRKLGFARVDVGNFGRWDRILATAAKDVRTFEAEPGFRTLIASRSFEVTLVTATLEKADRLRTSLSEKTHSAIPVQVIAVPRLLGLTGSIRAPPRRRCTNPHRGFCSAPGPGARKNNGQARCLATVGGGTGLPAQRRIT